METETSFISVLYQKSLRALSKFESITKLSIRNQIDLIENKYLEENKKCYIDFGLFETFKTSIGISNGFVFF